MYPKLSRKAKAATACVAAPAAYTGGINYRPGGWWGPPPSVRCDPYQEANVIPIPAFKAEAAVASAAASAQLSALQGNLIVPSLRRKAIAFRPIFSAISPRYPFQYINISLCSTGPDAGRLTRAIPIQPM
jgi:hypothetical protein